MRAAIVDNNSHCSGKTGPAGPSRMWSGTLPESRSAPGLKGDDAAPGVVVLVLVGHEGGSRLGDSCSTLSCARCLHRTDSEHVGTDQGRKMAFEALEHITSPRCSRSPSRHRLGQRVPSSSMSTFLHPALN